MMAKSKKGLLAFFILIFIGAVVVLTGLGGITAQEKPDHSMNRDSAAAAASEKSPVGEVPESFGRESIFWPLIKLIAALVVVVVAIYGFLFVLKMMMGRRFSPNNHNRMIEVLETTYVAQKKAVSLVRVSNRAVLVGISDNGLTALAEISPEETSKIMTEYAGHEKASGFGGVLRDVSTKLRSMNFKEVRPAKATN